MSSVHGGKIVWCLLSTVAKKNLVSFVHTGKNSLVSFGSGVFLSYIRKKASLFAQTIKLNISAAKSQNKLVKEHSNLKSVIRCDYMYFLFHLNLCEQSLG